MADTEIALRLEKLERDNRRLKAIALAALLLPGALLLMGEARASHTFTANKFVLRDAQGRPSRRSSGAPPVALGLPPGLSKLILSLCS
jgi:hypothetical protein